MDDQEEENSHNLAHSSDLEIPDCPFVNLPETHSGRWGQGLTKEKMQDCRWLKPILVGQFEFAEWTPEGHLRHSRFVGLREDSRRTWRVTLWAL
jgi:ATP-dependent DNA ligase